MVATRKSRVNQPDTTSARNPGGQNEGEGGSRAPSRGQQGGPMHGKRGATRSREPRGRGRGTWRSRASSPESGSNKEDTEDTRMSEDEDLGHLSVQGGVGPSSETYQAVGADPASTIHRRDHAKSSAVFHKTPSQIPTQLRFQDPNPASDELKGFMEGIVKHSNRMDTAAHNALISKVSIEAQSMDGTYPTTYTPW
ncbi:hypothetical protein BD410DRAFT_846460 [Rickenella mellea]|uniref:Uncharacterized protein n=1 Tax=Rickenella mellea TaxID=50990 RepID=A0A4Y7PHT5_9AGAM|nr:hypothetical protein BD410DRAFT_846460 [Rickenella mellea]